MEMDIEEVTEIANEYMKKAGYSYTKVESVKHENGKWKVVISSVLRDVTKTIFIDDSNGKVIGYE